MEGHLVASSKQAHSLLTLTNCHCPDEKRNQCLDDSLTQIKFTGTESHLDLGALTFIWD